jgi:hypothetical protein
VDHGPPESDDEIIEAEIIDATYHEPIRNLGNDYRVHALEQKVARQGRVMTVVACALAVLGVASLVVGLSNTPSTTPNDGAIRIEPTSLPTATLSEPYSASLVASGSAPPYSWTVASGQLPKGLSMSRSGSLRGKPEIPGTFPFTVAVHSSHGVSDTQALSLTVAGAAPIVTKVQPASGPGAGGIQVVIFGTGLTGATSVLFGGQPATRFQVNPGGASILARTPANRAGAVDVMVTTPSGTSVSNVGNQFTYQAPAVSRISPKTGTGGTPVAIVGSYLKGTSTVLFGSVPSTSFTVNAAGTSVTAVAPPQTGLEVDVTVTTPGGTSVIGPDDHFTYS